MRKPQDHALIMDKPVRFRRSALKDRKKIVDAELPVPYIALGSEIQASCCRAISNCCDGNGMPEITLENAVSPKASDGLEVHSSLMTRQRPSAQRVGDSWRSKTISACAGFLFALAAILKTHELLVSQSLDSSTTVIASLGVIAFEFAMGFWLLSLWNSTSARYVAVCVFWGYCLVSISNIAKGVVDCGCFGVYRVPPAASLLICLTALISMCATLRTKSGKRLSSTGMMPAWILLFLASCSIVYGASIKASIHENSGPLKAAIGGALDLGETKKGSDLKFGIELRNASSEHPITITGIHPDCGCTQVIEVSTLDLAPAATGSVAFTWHVEGNPKT